MITWVSSENPLTPWQLGVRFRNRKLWQYRSKCIKCHQSNIQITQRRESVIFVEEVLGEAFSAGSRDVEDMREFKGMISRPRTSLNKGKKVEKYREDIYFA